MTLGIVVDHDPNNDFSSGATEKSYVSLGGRPLLKGKLDGFWYLGSCGWV